jgi:alanine racemase
MISLEDLRNATGGQLFGDIIAERFNSFCHDVRLLMPGQLFVAIKTGSHDGHRDIEEAMARGAGGVLCQEPPTCDVTTTVVLVGDTVSALGQWAAYTLRRYDTTVIGVVGAIGKSSTCEAIAAVLGKRYRVYNNPDMLPGRHGIPLGLGGLEAEHQIALIELASEHPGEMADLLAIAQPHISVVTNISPNATQIIGEIERTQSESRQVLEALPQSGAAILNCDDEQVRQIQNQTRANLLTYGLDRSDVDLAAYNVQFHVDKVGFDLRHASRSYKGRWVPTLGRPGLYAALAALSVGVLFDVPIRDGLQALTNLRALPGRLSLLDGMRGSTLIDDTFDATPTSALAALELLAGVESGQGRRVFVLGDVHCRDEIAQQVHREIGQQAAQTIDLLVTRGDLAAVTGQAVRQAGMSGQQTALAYRHSDAASIVRDFIRRDDIVLVTGGRGARMEEVSAQLLGNVADRDWLPRQQAVPGDFVSSQPAWPSWIKLDLDAAAHNVRALKRRLNPGVGLMARVEANGYGHGAAQIASTAINNGADLLGVVSLSEGCQLRQAGIDAPILILGYAPAWEAQQVILNDLAVTLYDRATARIFAQVARELKRTARVHVKVDVGLGQGGLLPDEVIPLVRDLVRMDGLRLEGLYTNFSLADVPAEIAYTRGELDRFATVNENLRATGIDIPYIHAADSAALLTLLESHFTMVRAGLAMVGIAPSADVSCPPGFRPVMAWKTHVVQVRTLPAGWFVGYGNAYQTETEEQVAIIPVGYSDGYCDSPPGQVDVLLRGQRAPVIGRVAMYQSVVYISHIPDVQTGDEVVLIGQQGEQTITVEELAASLETTSYELVTGISSRIPRIV